MKYCSKCGQQIEDEAVVCIHCGRAVEGATAPAFNAFQPQPTKKAEDGPSVWWALLGFFVPLAGLILYIVWQKDYPQKARSCGKGALVAVIVEAAFAVLSMFTFLGLLSIASCPAFYY